LTDQMKPWEHSMAKKMMEGYRQAQEDYYLKAKPLQDLGNGMQAFSLITPPQGSPVARRRVRLIMRNLTSGDNASAPHLSVAGRAPHVITVAVTYDCQCDCLHCSASNHREAVRRDQNALSLEELKDAIGQCIDMGTTCVVLTGGEPLLFDGIFDLVASVDKSRSICTLFTNGEFLDRQTISRLKEAELFGLYVSFDYSDPTVHDANRRSPGLFDKAVRGLELCRDSGILTGISTYATREKITTGELDDMMELAKKLGVLEVFLFDVIPTGRLTNQHECILNAEEVEWVRAFRTRYNETPDYPRIIHQTMFASIAYPCVAEGCPAGMVQLHLRANGDVSPCDFTPYTFGNVRRQSIAEIWQSMSGSDLYATPSPGCRLAQPDYWASLAELTPTP
jgi:MoaA/NifB/PqqE/SkfB family radical SAM enzyme